MHINIQIYYTYTAYFTSKLHGYSKQQNDLYVNHNLSDKLFAFQAVTLLSNVFDQSIIKRKYLFNKSIVQLMWQRLSNGCRFKTLN